MIVLLVILAEGWSPAESIHLTENVFSLPSCRRRKFTPCRRLPMTGDQPSKRPSCRLPFGGTRTTCDRRLVFGVKFRGAEYSAYSNTQAFTQANIPNGLTVPSNLPMEVRRPWARHRIYHRTISSAGASGMWAPVDDVSRTITDWSPTLTTTSIAPACLAARITRAMSAWVREAGRRGII
jgi:hypothetical protein